MSNGKKTITRSFRISQEAFDALKEDAERRNITVNTLVNQIFLVHKNFDRYFERMGLVKLSATTFDLLLAAASKDEIIETARRVGEDAPRTIMMAKNGSISSQTIFDFLKSMSEYAKWFEYNEVDSSDGRKVITLMHRLGQNGSLFLIHYAKAIFGGIGLEPKVSSSEHSIVLEVRP